MSDGCDPHWVFREEVPCVFACLDDGVVAVPDQTAEFVGAQVVPAVVHGVEFGGIGWQRQQGDVVGDQQGAALLVPSSAVADAPGEQSAC